MGVYKPDVDDLGRVVDRRNQSVVITLNVEHHSVVANETSIPANRLYLRRPLPLCASDKRLLDAVVPIPTVEPGDSVWWHPDMIHAVEYLHSGTGYSKVMYIVAAPECAKNRAFHARQAAAFREGRSCPDFAPEDYEVDFVGRVLRWRVSGP